MPQFKKSIILSGATASGKSKFAIKLAQKYNGEIINADALQIYRDLPILSAQPDLKDQQLIKHHLYSFLAINDYFSVVKWLELVDNKMNEIFANNKTPIIVGGSGMYITKLIDGINEIPNISNKTKEIAQNDLKKYGLASIIQKSQCLNIKDTQRALRASEVLSQTNKPISYWQNLEKKIIQPHVKFTHYNLNLSRDILYKSCNDRFLEIIKNGAIEEVKIIKNQVKNNDKISNTIGYFEICRCLDNDINYEEMVELSCQKTRNYAKRQLTWFRNQLQQNSKRHIRIDC